MSAWSTRHMPDLSGKVVLVTGANSGLGLETARAVAAAGAHVVMACRDSEKGHAAIADIRAGQARAELELMALNLAELASIQRLAEAFTQAHDRLDMLINNAGVMALPKRRTADGFEMQIGTNHLGHFALTGLLMDTLTATQGSRVVTLSSLAHKMGRIDLDDLNWQRRRYRKWPAYGQSKLANLMFALELQRRLSAAGSKTISVAAHPGFAATNLQFVGPRMTGSRLAGAGMAAVNKLMAQSQAAGALPSLFAATAAQVRGGDYIGPDGVGELKGQPVKVEPSARAQKRDTAGKLWTLSEQLTGVRYRD